jgi:dTDP-4-amino-4,6-dideoxygalactose transaminase
LRERRIYLASPHMSEQGFEKQYIDEAFKTNWISPLGPNVDLFEKELADYVGVSHAAALSSGTAAIHLAKFIPGHAPRGPGRTPGLLCHTRKTLCGRQTL